jgi:GMP synthase-like glutamine amidotransferase
MPAVLVVQHTDSEYLGRLEDHLEGRGIGFKYVRPHVLGSWLPDDLEPISAVFIMGGGPWGAAGLKNLPILDEEITFIKNCLAKKIPVTGFGLGAQVLCLAAGGSSEPADLSFDVTQIERSVDKALNGYLPESFPAAIYMRDRPVPPQSASIFAQDENGNPAVFQIGENCFGFTGHPGIKVGMIEDLIMEFDDIPDGTSETLARLRGAQTEMEDALVYIMTGLVQMMGLMQRQKLGHNLDAMDTSSDCAA